MRTLQPPGRVRIGLMTIAVVVLVVGVGQSFTSVPVLMARPTYYGQFTDTGQLTKGDKVRIAGIDVGEVQGIKIDGDHIVMKFSIGSERIGTDSRLAIKTDTILGKRVLEIEPRGSQLLPPSGVLPLGQSTTPYQIYDALFDVTKAATNWDIDTVKQSLNVLSQTVNETYPQLSAALDGVAKFSNTIGKRDDQVKNLLAEARKVAGVLGNRSDQFNTLLVNANSLIAAVNERGREVSTLLEHVNSFSSQVTGLFLDSPNIHDILEPLRTVSDILRKHKYDLATFLRAAKNYITALNEATASGPYIKAMFVNLLPYQVIQPWVDAAFKKRGISPEEFWRNAGLPAFRYPDPNGTRFSNGAPPPAPPVLEGTPEHPGPAVVPGSPCSYAPAAGMFPTPQNPMPCAGLDASDGPFGPNGPYPGGIPDVLSSSPNPDGLPATPGIPVSGQPGETPPDVPGTPVPLPPHAPRGARGEPIGPVSGPTPGNPGAAHYPLQPPPGPPPPPAAPGPGEQLPVPFIPPGEGGNSQPGGGGGSLRGGGQN